MPVVWNNQKEGIKAGFITREDEIRGFEIRSVSGLKNVSDETRALENNRNVISRYFGRTDIALAMGKQVHGNHIVYAKNQCIIKNTDGLVTHIPGIAVAVLVADCAAVLMKDSKNKVIAAVHAGWRGAVQSIIYQAIKNMSILGGEPSEIDCFVGPCISVENFEVGEEVAVRFPEQFVDRSYRKPHVDLKNYVIHNLLECGISPGKISSDHRCTVEKSRILHSYRRDGDLSGRMMAVIVIT